MVAIGDAALGRDALASQGTAIGLSDTRLAAGPHPEREALSSRRSDGLDRHLRHLAGTLDACHHHEAPAWATYRRWVDNWRGVLSSATSLTPGVIQSRAVKGR